MDACTHACGKLVTVLTFIAIIITTTDDCGCVKVVEGLMSQESNVSYELPKTNQISFTIHFRFGNAHDVE